jgi:hypothetical protein
MTSVQLIIGLVLLLGGGEAMVKGSVAVPSGWASRRCSSV